MKEKLEKVIGRLEGEVSYLEYRLFGLVRVRVGKVYRAKAQAYQECIDMLKEVLADA